MGILRPNADKFLLEDFEPENIIDRKDEVSRLELYFFNKLLNDEQGNSLFAYGSSGTGKTLIIKKLIEQHHHEIKRHFPMFEWLWFNGKSLGTSYITYINIAKYLEKYLPVKTSYGEINEVPIKGYDGPILLNIIKNVIEQRGIELLIVIDEINEIVYNDGDTFIYNFVDANNNLKKGHLYLIGISNDVKLEEKFTPSVRSRFGCRVHFPKYNAQDLYDILEVFSRVTLNDGSYNTESLYKIASFVANESGSARDAKSLLFFLANKSVEKLDISKFDDATAEKEKMMYERDLETLPLQLKLAVLSISENYKTWEERRMNYSRRGLKRYLDDLKLQPTISNSYEIYLEVCKRYGEKAKSLSTFRGFIRSLEKDGMVTLDVRSFGRGGGITTLVRPTLPIDALKEMIINSLKWLG